jgi:ADP-ribose diphosphatase
MSLNPWKKIRQSFELKNPWWTYRKDDVLLPTGREGEYHFVHVNGSSMIIPLLDDGRMVLVNQYRYLASKESLEFPCGSVKDGSTHEQTAIMELSEETGFQAENLDCVAEFNPYNGVTDELCKVFIARHLTPVTARPDETEEFQSLILSYSEIERKIKAHIIWDGMTLAAWAIVRDIIRDNYENQNIKI